MRLGGTARYLQLIPLLCLITVLHFSLAVQPFVKAYFWKSNFPDEHVRKFDNSSISLCGAQCRKQGDCRMFRLEEWDGFRGTCWTSRRSYESKLTAREAKVMDEEDFFRGFAENRNVTEGT